jgi:hypothetical protein
MKIACEKLAIPTPKNLHEVNANFLGVQRV